MIAELAELIEAFPGGANRSRCFAHILNLAGRSIIRPFDLPKSKARAANSEAEKALEVLAANIEVEEMLSRNVAPEPKEDGEEADEVADDDVGWEDEDPSALMTVDEQEEWDEASVPVRLMLVKVSHRLHKSPIEFLLTFSTAP